MTITKSAKIQKSAKLSKITVNYDWHVSLILVLLAVIIYATTLHNQIVLNVSKNHKKIKEI